RRKCRLVSPCLPLFLSPFLPLLFCVLASWRLGVLFLTPSNNDICLDRNPTEDTICTPFVCRAFIQHSVRFGSGTNTGGRRPSCSCISTAAKHWSRGGSCPSSARHSSLKILK